MKDPLGSDPGSVGLRGAHVAMGNTEPGARLEVLGLEQRGQPDGPAFSRVTGQGYVAAVAAPYDRARRNGCEVVPLLFETFGGLFGPEVMNIPKQAAGHVQDKLSHTKYDETTWSVRKWTPFAMQQISVALHRALAWEIGWAQGLPISGGIDPRSASGGG